MQMTLRYPRGGRATAPIMQRNEGESPEGIGGMTSNPWTGNSREGRDSNAKVPCIEGGYTYFLELYINRNDKKSIAFMRAPVKIV